DLERQIALGIERLRRRHAAGHPEEDAGIRRRLGMLDLFGRAESRLPGGERGQCGRGHAAEEITARTRRGRLGRRNHDCLLLRRVFMPSRYECTSLSSMTM